MTYSIVAHDPKSGQMGVAVQTCNLAVGSWVPWAAAGVGAVATQAAAERSYGTLGLALLRGRMAPAAALEALLAADPGRAFRQVALVDAQGRVATHTGARCLPEAGSQCGDGFCTQANMMARDTVWAAMADAFQQAKGDLASRFLAALAAAEEEGGDIRGRQTAAMLIVGPERGTFPMVNLRVDHHPDPVAELRRLLRLHRAYDAEYRFPEMVAAGERAAAHAFLQQMEAWAPEEGYLHYLRALHLAGRLDRWQEALAVLRPLIAEDPVWGEFLRRDAEVDHFDCDGVSKQLLEALALEAKEEKES